jgi:hypothetical protein
LTDLETIRAGAEQLCNGWSEKIEYSIMVNRQIERRAKTIRHPSLIHDLRRHVGVPRQGEKCERTAPNKPGSRPPGDMSALYLLDEITVEAEYLRTRIRQENGLGDTADTPKIEDLLTGLVESLAFMEAGHPDLLGFAAALSSGWVRRARLLLGYDKPRATLRDAVCPDCGGQLAVAADASSDVLCVGDGVNPPCGRVYGQAQWIALAGRNFRGGVARGDAA